MVGQETATRVWAWFIKPLDKPLTEEQARAKVSLHRDTLGLGALIDEYANSPDVARRLMRMGHLFGLSKQPIAHPNTQAKLLVESCNTCRNRSHCFRDRNGAPVDHPGFDIERCPVIETLRAIAKRDGNRTAIRNRMI
jgi:hypothetical protein